MEGSVILTCRKELLGFKWAVLTRENEPRLQRIKISNRQNVFFSNKNKVFLMIFIQDDGGWTPLVWACENKHEDVIR